MFERFTESARRVVVLAQEESRLLGHRDLGVEHLLLGLLRGDDSTARTVLGVTQGAAHDAVARLSHPDPRAPSGPHPVHDRRPASHADRRGRGDPWRWAHRAGSSPAGCAADPRPADRAGTDLPSPSTSSPLRVQRARWLPVGLCFGGSPARALVVADRRGRSTPNPIQAPTRARAPSDLVDRTVGTPPCGRR